MSRPRLLDLFCGAGGCSVGYHRAGFDVVGVDIRRRSPLPVRVPQGRRLDVPARRLRRHPRLAALPGPQRSRTSRQPPRHRLDTRRDPRTADRTTGRRGSSRTFPAPRCGPTTSSAAACSACRGCSRERWFETSWHGFALNMGHACTASRRSASSATDADMGPAEVRLQHDHRPVPGSDGHHWMDRNELSQAIPPAYTELVGRALLEHLASEAAA